jgi:dihydrofolate reductase
LKISVYIATSLDGFIARSDGRLDWLEGASGEVSDPPEDYGFWEFFNTVDTMVMGRGTYEFVAGTDQWVYEGKRVIVLSSTLSADDVAPHWVGKVEFVSMDPEALVSMLAAAGTKHIYVDGGVTIQQFLRAGLVDEVILSRMPVLIGSGIPLFGELDADVQLQHVATREFAGGMVQSRYAVKG